MRRHIRGEYTPLADVDVRVLPAVPRGGRSVTWARQDQYPACPRVTIDLRES